MAQREHVGEELRDEQFLFEMQKTLTVTGIEPVALQLEVTESIFFQGSESIDKILRGIRATGVRIALDEFGTGYSSLSYLDRYQIDTIKIDRSFLADMLTRRRTMAIVQTVVRLGQALELDVVAEGVEQGEQLQALLDTGCGAVQGFPLGRPLWVDQVDVAAAEQFARKPRSRPIGKMPEASQARLPESITNILRRRSSTHRRLLDTRKPVKCRRPDWISHHETSASCVCPAHR